MPQNLNAEAQQTLWLAPKPKNSQVLGCNNQLGCLNQPPEKENKAAEGLLVQLK